MPLTTIPRSTTTPLTTASRIVITGAGVFGLSTGFHLLRRGYTDVIILDRAGKLPAVDAASTDINKIVRSCYTDVFYTNLAREAMKAWKDPMWKSCYHECGVISVGSQQSHHILEDNDRRLGSLTENLPDIKAVRSKLVASLSPPGSSAHPGSNDHRIGQLTNSGGYFNPEGGWVEATRAVEILFSHVRRMGGKVIPNQEVTNLVRDEHGQTMGVRCRDGTYFKGDKIILTIGSWTASTFPELRLDSVCLATGHPVAMVQLTPEEMERYKCTHVFLNFDNGLYTFPPTQDGIVKVSMHTAGYTHMIAPVQLNDDGIGDSLTRKISAPRTTTSHPDSGDGLRVPRPALRALKTHFGEVYPELAEKPWCGTRMCWYADAPDGDWVIGPFPGDPTLFLATSGSGHGFKFLPNVGRLVADCLEGVLDPATAARFAVDRNVVGATNAERASVATRELDITELCGPEEESKM